MTTQKVKRKLTAVLSADAEGYSRLIGEDEKAKMRILNAYKKVITEFVQKHKGRLVGTGGDSVLAEFPSVVDAVRCAVEIQEDLKNRNKELSEELRMEFRIGINLGDVVEDGDTIYEDGVNIARRLESLAEAGGICISGTAYDQVKSELSLGYKYLGEQFVEDIAKPVQVYRVLIEPETASKAIIEKQMIQSYADKGDANFKGDRSEKETILRDAWSKQSKHYDNNSGKSHSDANFKRDRSERETFFGGQYGKHYNGNGSKIGTVSKHGESLGKIERLDTIVVRRKGRIKYFDPMELDTEYPLKIALLREMKERNTTTKGIKIKWGDIGFIPKEEDPEIEILPKSTFFIFSPSKRIAVVKADKDVFTDFSMRPLLLTQSTKVHIEFLYKREHIGLIAIDVRIQDKLKIVGGIKLSHEKWRKVISIATALATIGVFLDVSRNLFESWRHIWLGSAGYLLIAASIPPFLLGTFLGVKGSRRMSKDF